jgi:hypothetical protein
MNELTRQARKIVAAQDMSGAMNICFERTDVPMMHIIVRGEPGEPFPVGVVTQHFASCQVCRAHAVTLETFQAFMAGIGQPEPSASPEEAIARMVEHMRSSHECGHRRGEEDPECSCCGQGPRVVRERGKDKEPA